MKGMRFYYRWAIQTFFGLFYHYPYCPLWDAKVSELLDSEAVEAELSGHILYLSGHQVVVGGQLSYYGHLENGYSQVYGGKLPERRPSIKTMRRLYQLVEKIRQEREVEQNRLYIQAMEEL